MTIDKSILSVGQFLRAERHGKNIALEKIVSETRISVDILRAIEREDYRHLPAEVYVKGFLRAYARALEIDGDEVVKRYLASRETESEDSTIEPERPRFGQRLWLRVVLVMISFAALIGSTLFIMSAHDQNDQNDQKTGPAQAAKAPASAAALKSLPPKVEKTRDKPRKETPAKKRLKHKLEVRAVESTWMKVITDGGQPKVYQLEAGDVLALEASSGFNLLIGNAGGVRLVFDRKAIAVHGKSGQVATLQLP